MRLRVFTVFTVCTLFMVSMVSQSAYGDYLETLNLYFQAEPDVCIMEPNPALIPNFYPNIYNMTKNGINHWEETMYKATSSDSLWDFKVFEYPWETHSDKETWDFPHCSIFVVYDKENTKSDALAFASFDFSKSNHKWSMVNMFLNHYPKQSFHIQIGNGTNNSITVDFEKKQLPLEDLNNIFLHEFGHAAFGLGHYWINDRNCVPDKSCQERSIMYHSLDPFINQTKSITNEDVEMVIRLHGEDGFGLTKPRWNPDECSFVNGTISTCR